LDVLQITKVDAQPRSQVEKPRHLGAVPAEACQIDSVSQKKNIKIKKPLVSICA
jgi:hypothetical protein